MEKQSDDKTLITKTYNVAELVMPRVFSPDNVYPPAPTLTTAGKQPLDTDPNKPKLGNPVTAPGGVTRQDFEPIMNVIKNTIAPDSWNRGGGAVEVFVPNLSLIISTTEKNHEQIEELLTKILELTAISGQFGFLHCHRS